MHSGSRISKVQLVSRLGVLMKATQSSPTAQELLSTGSSEQPICSYNEVQCWELPPINISVQPRLPKAVHKNTWVWCWNGTHGASFHGKQREAGSRIISHPVKELIHDQRLPWFEQYHLHNRVHVSLALALSFNMQKELPRWEASAAGSPGASGMWPESCIFSSCKQHNFPTQTSVLSEIFPTFLQCPQSSSSILPSS